MSCLLMLYESGDGDVGTLLLPLDEASMLDIKIQCMTYVHPIRRY